MACSVCRWIARVMQNPEARLQSQNLVWWMAAPCSGGRLGPRGLRLLRCDTVMFYLCVL